jgi:hypothetical protein
VRDGNGEFDEEILADLITQGLSGEELLAKFKETRRKIRPAVENMLNEAVSAAKGDATYSTYKEVFETEAE